MHSILFAFSMWSTNPIGGFSKREERWTPATRSVLNLAVELFFVNLFVVRLLRVFSSKACYIRIFTNDSSTLPG